MGYYSGGGLGYHRISYSSLLCYNYRTSLFTRFVRNIHRDNWKPLNERRATQRDTIRLRAEERLEVVKLEQDVGPGLEVEWLPQKRELNVLPATFRERDKEDGRDHVFLAT